MLTPSTSDRAGEAAVHLLAAAKRHAVVEGEQGDAYLLELIAAEIDRIRAFGVVLLASSFTWTGIVPEAGSYAASLPLPLYGAAVGQVTCEAALLAPGPDYQAEGGRLYFAPRLGGKPFAAQLTAGLASTPEALPADLVLGLARRVATQYAQREDLAAGVQALPAGSADDYLAPYLPARA